ncbi:MAG: YihY family inner membrane protein [Burkholderiaceae bacterium]
MKSRLQQRAEPLIQALQHWPWLETAKTLRLRFREDRLGQIAGSLTFTTLISLVPLVTVTLAVLSAFPMFGNLEGTLQKYLLQALVPDSIARPVLTAVTQFAGKANRLGTVGLVSLALAVLALMVTIDRALNAIWRVRTPRPVAQRVLVYWTAATLGPLLLALSLSATSYALSASQGLVGTLPGGLSVLLASLQFVFLAAGLAGLYHYAPNTHVQWRHAWAGGLFATAGFEVAKRALGWYLGNVSSYALIYGAFATLPIFLIWIYFGWVIVLLGAVIAAYAPSLQRRVVRWRDGPGAQFHLAVALLSQLAHGHGRDAHGLSASDLSLAMRIDPLQIEPILDRLASLDWVGRLEEPENPRYVLLCDPSTTPARPLLAQLLLEPSGALHGFWERAGFGDVMLADVLRD